MFKNLLKSKKEKEITSHIQSFYSYKQLFISQDNRTCQISFLIGYNVIDYAAYKKVAKNLQRNPEYLTVVTTRNVIANYDLDEIIQKQETLTAEVVNIVNDACTHLGIKVVDIVFQKIHIL